METLKYTFIQHEPVTWESYALHNENKEFIDKFTPFVLLIISIIVTGNF